MFFDCAGHDIDDLFPRRVLESHSFCSTIFAGKAQRFFHRWLWASDCRETLANRIGQSLRALLNRKSKPWVAVTLGCHLYRGICTRSGLSASTPSLVGAVVNRTSFRGRAYSERRISEGHTIDWIDITLLTLLSSKFYRKKNVD